MLIPIKISTGSNQDKEIEYFTFSWNFMNIFDI
jgi:hypothetical protein